MRNTAALKGTWGFEDLDAVCKALKPHVSLPGLQVLCSSQRDHRFFECDDSKNVYAGMYHIREPETKRLDMSPAEFVSCARSWVSQKLMLKVAVIPPKCAAKCTAAALDTTSPGGPIATSLRGNMDWNWLTSLLAAQQFGPILRADLEATTAHALLPARYALHDEFLVQLSGRRRVLLVSPDQAFSGMFPYPTAHPYDKYSMVDLHALDPGQWPGCTQLKGVVAVLRPGDLLHIPAFWFVVSHDLEAENVTLRVKVHPGTRAPAADASPLRLSRTLEERVAAVEGPGGVRRWLRLVGAGREVETLDLGTVEGYRRAVMCQGIRDEVEETLGAGAWAELLPAVCRGRLVPTPWLNANYKPPLLLANGPMVYEDTRTEEERKYPTLFRRKLESEGWNVPASVSTVPIPGVNVPMQGAGPLQGPSLSAFRS